jgi:hypothetical protein
MRLPHKKRRGKKMTKKRSLLLISLFLAFGLATMATSAFAQNAFTLSNNQNLDARSEGMAEGVGTITFTTVSTGTMSPGDKFTITYNAPIAGIGTVYITTSGTKTIIWGTPVLSNGNKTLTIPVTGSLAGNTASPGSALAVAVRVNCTQFAPGGGQVTAIVTASYTTGTALTITNTLPYPLAIVQPEPALSLGFGTEHAKMEAAANVLTCLGVKQVGSLDNDFTLNIDENFTAALTSESYEINVLDPGSGGPGETDVTNPTEFTVTFSNVPEGVGIAATDVKPCGTLWTGNPLYCANGTLGVSAAGAPVVTADTGTPPTHTVSFTYSVTNQDADMPETVDLDFRFWSHGQIDPVYGMSSIVANVALGPTTPTTDIPLFTTYTEGPTTGASAGPYNLAVAKFWNCQTTLLYPYLANGGGWDTGIAVSNTTMDPFATDPILSKYLAKGTATQQSGPCSFWLYATGGQVGSTYVTPTIMSGSTYAFDMGANLAPNVSGYAIAVCQFQNAHGYAFITYNLFGDNGVAANYIADVLPDPQWYRRNPAGDGLGETAVAPYWISRELEKELIYGTKK